MLYHLKPDCWWARAQYVQAKRSILKNAFFEAVQDSDEEMHLIAAQDLDAINDNILEGFDGLLNIYPEYLKNNEG